MDERILNTGLHLAMAWGKDWLQPIQPRLSAAYPTLTEPELAECNRLCQTAIRLGHTLAAESCMGMSISKPLFRKDKELIAKQAAEVEHQRREFTSTMRETFPWIDDANMAALYSQGSYYAMK